MSGVKGAPLALRTYRKIWEIENPWLTKKMDGEKEIAHCTWCNVDLGCITTRFKEHRQTMKHRKNDPEGNFRKMMKDVDEAKDDSSQEDEEERVIPNTMPKPPVATQLILTRESSKGEPEPPVCLDFSKPLPKDVLEMLSIGQASSQIKDDTIEVSSMEEGIKCTLKGNTQHQLWFQEELTEALLTGSGFDLIWKCDGGTFRAHKLVLALFSLYFKKILPDTEELATLYTPELSKETVRTILKIIYTGEASLDGSLLDTIYDDFSALGFEGIDLAAKPSEDKLDHETTLSYSPQHSEDDDYSGFEDKDVIDPVFTNCKKEKESIKIELEEEENEILPKSKRIKLEESSNNKESKKSSRKKEKNIDDDLMDQENLNNLVRQTEKGQSKINSHYYRETQFTYSVKSKKRKRGLLSRQLPYDLFDDVSVAEQVIFMTVCPVCLKVFDEVDKMREHRTEVHHMQPNEWNRSKNSKMILDKRKLQKFHCDKCDEKFVLKHLVWFVKHYKYCGVDDEKASQILRIDDIEDDFIVQKENNKDDTKDSDVLIVRDTPRHRDMCSVMLEKENSSEIWGCRKCYEAFEQEDDLKMHINNAHEGKFEHGTFYDEESKTYSCQKCKVFRTNKNVVYFIYHLKKCEVNSKSGVPIDDEEDVDEDTSEDFVDPWGIIYKPLKVRNERSKWICESLFGELHEILYPCHVCYTVFKSEEEIREHFRTIHPGMQNFAEYGRYYNNTDKGYDCPVCKRNICKKDKNTIYFTYHMHKCRGNLHAVVRECPDCQEKFTSLKMYQLHLQSKCGALSFVCHICGLALKSKQSLKNHVVYFHTEERKHKCNVCDTSFKRQFDLKNHMRRHMGSLDFSCEKCGKAFPVKKALTKHMKTHFTDAEKSHVCHVCGNRFALKVFLINHLTTHSDFRGFACEVCNVKLKTRDSLTQHRRKVHKLTSRIPESCILKPEDPEILLPSSNLLQSNSLLPAVRLKRGGGGVRPVKKPMIKSTANQRLKEEPFAILKEELKLTFNE